MTSIPETAMLNADDREVFEHNIEQVFEMGRAVGREQALLETNRPERLLISCEEAGRMLGVKPWPVHELCREGKLRHGWIGEQIVIPVEAVREYAETVTA